MTAAGQPVGRSTDEATLSRSSGTLVVDHYDPRRATMLHAARRARVGRLALLLLMLLTFLSLFHPLPAFADGGTAADSSGSIVSSTALWGILVGIMTPPLVAIVQQPQWSTRTRSLIGTGIAVGLAAITCWVDGSIGHGQTLLVTIGTVVIASQTTYRELWSKVGVTQAIEGATSPGAAEGDAGDSQADPPVKATTRTRSRRGG